MQSTSRKRTLFALVKKYRRSKMRTRSENSGQKTRLWISWMWIPSDKARSRTSNPRIRQRHNRRSATSPLRQAQGKQAARACRTSILPWPLSLPFLYPCYPCSSVAKRPLPLRSQEQLRQMMRLSMPYCLVPAGCVCLAHGGPDIPARATRRD